MEALPHLLSAGGSHKTRGSWLARAGGLLCQRVLAWAPSSSPERGAGQLAQPRGERDKGTSLWAGQEACPLLSQGPVSSGSQRLAGAISRLLGCGDFFTIALTSLFLLLYRNYDF